MTKPKIMFALLEWIHHLHARLQSLRLLCRARADPSQLLMCTFLTVSLGKNAAQCWSRLSSLVMNQFSPADSSGASSGFSSCFSFVASTAIAYASKVATLREVLFFTDLSCLRCLPIGILSCFFLGLMLRSSRMRTGLRIDLPKTARRVLQA